jgi:hypothetical protein
MSHIVTITHSHLQTVVSMGPRKAAEIVAKMGPKQAADTARELGPANVGELVRCMGAEQTAQLVSGRRAYRFEVLLCWVIRHTCTCRS